MIEISFEHWCYTFTEEMLSKYGSRYFSRRDAGLRYANDIYERSDRVSIVKIECSENQIRSGNEAFAEAAVADPIADLEVWDEWRSGTRYFPYPGRYSRLGITRQDDKTSSPSSVGVIGEIMAGFFAQAGVSPWVLVRVVRRWPDFIFSDRDGTYSFVESKAFTNQSPEREGLANRVLGDLLVEGAVDAAQQLNCDAYGRVWNSFTKIASMSPLQFDVTFLELNVPDARRDAQPLRIMPAAVVDGLAERAVNRAVAQISPIDTVAKLSKPMLRKEVLVPELRILAQNEIDVLLSEIDLDVFNPVNRQPIEHAVETILARVAKRKWKPKKSDDLGGRRLMEAKEEAVQGLLSRIRGSGKEMIYIADLPEEEVIRIKRTWTPDWTRASSPWGTIDGEDLWRCGGAVVCIAGNDLQGRNIRSFGSY